MFKPSFVGIWPFEHEFQSGNFDQLNFQGYQTCQQTVQKFAKFHLHFCSN